MSKRKARRASKAIEGILPTETLMLAARSYYFAKEFKDAKEVIPEQISAIFRALPYTAYFLVMKHASKNRLLLPLTDDAYKYCLFSQIVYPDRHDNRLKTAPALVEQLISMLASTHTDFNVWFESESSQYNTQQVQSVTRRLASAVLVMRQLLALVPPPKQALPECSAAGAAITELELIVNAVNRDSFHVQLRSCFIKAAQAFSLTTITIMLAPPMLLASGLEQSVKAKFDRYEKSQAVCSEGANGNIEPKQKHWMGAEKRMVAILKEKEHNQIFLKKAMHKHARFNPMLQLHYFFEFYYAKYDPGFLFEHILPYDNSELAFAILADLAKVMLCMPYTEIADQLKLLYDQVYHYAVEKNLLNSAGLHYLNCLGQQLYPILRSTLQRQRKRIDYQFNGLSVEGVVDDGLLVDLLTRLPFPQMARILEACLANTEKKGIGKVFYRWLSGFAGGDTVYGDLYEFVAALIGADFSEAVLPRLQQIFSVLINPSAIVKQPLMLESKQKNLRQLAKQCLTVERVSTIGCTYYGEIEEKLEIRGIPKPRNGTETLDEYVGHLDQGYVSQIIIQSMVRDILLMPSQKQRLVKWLRERTPWQQLRLLLVEPLQLRSQQQQIAITGPSVSYQSPHLQQLAEGMLLLDQKLLDLQPKKIAKSEVLPKEKKTRGVLGGGLEAVIEEQSVAISGVAVIRYAVNEQHMFFTHLEALMTVSPDVGVWKQRLLLDLCKILQDVILMHMEVAVGLAALTFKKSQSKRSDHETKERSDADNSPQPAWQTSLLFGVVSDPKDRACAKKQLTVLNRQLEELERAIIKGKNIILACPAEDSARTSTLASNLAQVKRQGLKLYHEWIALSVVFSPASDLGEVVSESLMGTPERQRRGREKRAESIHRSGLFSPKSPSPFFPSKDSPVSIRLDKLGEQTWYTSQHIYVLLQHYLNSDQWHIAPMLRAQDLDRWLWDYVFKKQMGRHLIKKQWLVIPIQINPLSSGRPGYHVLPLVVQYPHDNQQQVPIRVFCVDPLGTDCVPGWILHALYRVFGDTIVKRIEVIPLHLLSSGCHYSAWVVEMPRRIQAAAQANKPLQWPHRLLAEVDIRQRRTEHMTIITGGSYQLPPSVMEAKIPPSQGLELSPQQEQLLVQMVCLKKTQAELERGLIEKSLTHYKDSVIALWSVLHRPAEDYKKTIERKAISSIGHASSSAVTLPVMGKKLSSAVLRTVIGHFSKEPDPENKEHPIIRSYDDLVRMLQTYQYQYADTKLHACLKTHYPQFIQLPPLGATLSKDQVVMVVRYLQARQGMDKRTMSGIVDYWQALAQFQYHYIAEHLVVALKELQSSASENIKNLEAAARI